jgi:hypothetical protein
MRLRVSAHAPLRLDEVFFGKNYIIDESATRARRAKFHCARFQWSISRPLNVQSIDRMNLAHVIALRGNQFLLNLDWIPTKC